jgi:aromatic-L-amino-acid decarboxylase
MTGTGEEEIDALNERVLEEVNRRGKVYLSHTKLNGRFALRLAIGNIRTAEEHVRLAWDELQAALGKQLTA